MKRSKLAGHFLAYSRRSLLAVERGPRGVLARHIGAIALYVFAGIYQVDEQERGVVFRFGKVQFSSRQRV